jgi:DNA-binding response OmpR family regulator
MTVRVEMLPMSMRVVVFSATPNALTLYWAILTAKHYEVLAYGQDVMTLEEVASLAPVLILIDNIAGYVPGELDTFHSLCVYPALAVIPIILVTSSSTLSALYPFLQSMTNVSIITQPFGYQELWALVERVLENRKGLREGNLRG